ncbi:MAG: hypothetical protein WD042_04210 [Phycisphaeraceae bacterium]
MKTTRLKIWTAATITGAAVMLAGAAPAWAADGHRGARNDRHRSHPVVVVRQGHDYRRHGHDYHQSGHYGSGVRVGVTFGSPQVVTVPSQRWVEGYYVTTTQRVLVEPGHYETRQIERITRTYYPKDGPAYTVVVQEGGTQQVWVPDHYETRTVQTWVPGHWETYGTTVIHRPATRVSIGGVIRF